MNGSFRSFFIIKRIDSRQFSRLLISRTQIWHLTNSKKRNHSIKSANLLDLNSHRSRRVKWIDIIWIDIMLLRSPLDGIKTSTRQGEFLPWLPPNWWRTWWLFRNRGGEITCLIWSLPAPTTKLRIQRSKTSIQLTKRRRPNSSTMTSKANSNKTWANKSIFKT